MTRMITAVSLAALLIGLPALAIAQPETTPGKKMQLENPDAPRGKKTDPTGPGASEYAPGQTNDPSAPGKSEYAPGQTTEPGNSENAPPRTK